MTSKQNSITTTFEWGNIQITVVIRPNYIDATQFCMDNVEITSSKPNPITETGYKSEFHEHPCHDWILEDIKNRLGEPERQIALF